MAHRTHSTISIAGSMTPVTGRAARANAEPRRSEIGQRLPEEDAGRLTGPPGQLADHLVPAVAVEVRRLVAVGVQVHLAAAPARSFGLGRRQEPGTESLAAQVVPDP